MATQGMVMEVLGKGRGKWKWMEVWALTLASIAGYGHPSLGRGGVERKGSSCGGALGPRAYRDSDRLSCELMALYLY